MYILAQQSQADVVTLPSKEASCSLPGTTTRHLNRVLKQLSETGAVSGAYPQLRVLNRALLLNPPL
ncbi:MAG: winged helix-turn-helix domain-containing protein, partial [Anaerolineae bacterium]|nr:winged helix-turn-helix domain-containing protein [Anaerolineae bacterium]